MANACSVIIRKSKTLSAPTPANLLHNSGMKPAAYWLGDGSDLMQSLQFQNTREMNEVWKTWTDAAEERYRLKHNRQIRSNAVKIEEGLMVIGSDVRDLDREEIRQIIENFNTKFEGDNNTEILHWSYHDHEGHESEDETRINRHIHFLFSNVSNDGGMVRRNWKRSYMKQLQSDIYEAALPVVPDIERAIDYASLNLPTPRQEHHRVFRKKAEIEEENKKQKKELARLKDVEAQYKAERAQLKASGEATQRDYQELKKLYDELKEQARSKDLTIKQLTAERDRYGKLLDGMKAELFDESERLQEADREAMSAFAAAVFVPHEDDAYGVPSIYDLPDQYYSKQYGTVTVTGTKGSDNVKIVDRGDALVGKGTDMQAQVRMMFEMAQAKGWALEDIDFIGSEEFINAGKQIRRELLKPKIFQSAPETDDYLLP